MITIKDVEHVAKLARLELTEDEKELYTKQLGDVLKYVDQMNEVDTSNVKPMTQVIDFVNVMREDKVVYEQTKEGNSYIGKSSIYYTSNSNLIWAINVPTDIPHTYEKADFLEAYPHFKDWATSGGNQNKDWYENSTGNRNDSYLIKQ